MFATQVIFGVNGQKYSFNSLYVRAVEHSCSTTMLPGAPECIVGVTELRGEWIPICDLEIKFKTGNRGKADRDKSAGRGHIPHRTSCRHIGP